MAYTKNTWLPRIGTGLNKFTDQNGNEWTLTSAPTEVQQAGTPFTADWMNHIEDGIYNAAARADISSNPNFFINSGFTVWQRGESFTVPRTGTGAGQYTADRWRVWANTDSAGGNIVVTKVDGGLHVEASGAGIATYRFEEADAKRLTGKTVTLSRSVDGVVSSETQSFPANGTFNVPLPASGTLNWVKLELGGEATPYVPKGYGEELAACMRYYQVTGSVFCAGYANAGTAYASYVPPVPLRTTPTLGGNVNNTTVRSIDAAPIYDQTLSLTASQSSGAALYLTTTAPNVTANRPCVMQFGGIVLDAEMG